MLPQNSSLRACPHQCPGGLTHRMFRSLSWCVMAAFPMSELGRRPHQMVSGLARCSFALRPARSLTSSFQRPFTPRASNTSLLPCPPRLLPAGAKVAGWDFVSSSHWSSAPFHGALKHALTRKFHVKIEQRSGERVRRLENTRPNDDDTHRFFCDRL